MLPKEKRLRNTKDFKRVYQKGSFFSVRGFSLNFLPNKSGISRVGVVVNKKISPKSVVRNKLKRQIREVVRELYPSLPKGYDVIISAKGDLTKVDFQNLRLEMEKAFGRIK